MNSKIYFSNYQANQSAINNLLQLIATSSKIKQALADNQIEYASIYKGQGLYQGGKETSYQIELYNVDSDKSINLAKTLRQVFNQDSVMVVINNKQPMFIEE